MMRQSNPNRVVNRKIDLDQFLHRRPQVLGQWQTGADVDIDEAIAFHHAMPAARNFARKVVEADRANETLAIPRVGDPVLDEHIAHLKTCAAAGADLLPSITDGYTRFNQWQRAADGLEDCARQGRSLLNGFPIVAHGPTGVRRLVEESGLPVMNNCGSVLVPLVAEVGFAGGMTALLGTPVAYCLNHHADVPFDEAIRQRFAADTEKAGQCADNKPTGRQPRGQPQCGRCGKADIRVGPTRFFAYHRQADNDHHQAEQAQQEIALCHLPHSRSRRCTDNTECREKTCATPFHTAATGM